MQKLLAFVAVSSLSALSAWAGSVNVTVPGLADIYLVGQPDGTNLGGDSTPANSPVLVSGLDLTAGKILTFSASGTTGGAGCAPSSPDGCSVFSTSGANSLGAFTGPASALVGAFLNASPATGTAPADLGGATNLLSLSPLLNQVFFIGDGLTGEGSGSVQSFVVPVGAAFFVLASSDTAGTNYNNDGSFSVTINEAVTGPTATPEPASFLLVCPAAAAAILLRRKGTAAKRA